jgi:AraC-like DNA-binding protein
MPAPAVLTLLKTNIVTIRDVCWLGGSQPWKAEWNAGAVQLLFPYRGTCRLDFGDESAIAEANQVLLLNAGETCRVSNSVGGERIAFLALAVEETLLRELAAEALLQEGLAMAFRTRRLRVDARTQALAAMLRHGLDKGIAEPLEAESLGLILAQRALGPRTAHIAETTIGRHKLVDRTKLIVGSDLARRWTLNEIAAQVGVSPVYLTQVFRQVEGIPLYRYYLRLRLARALDLIVEYDDLTGLGLDLGFSSHSHFTAAFREAYGRSPSEFRQAALHR